MTRSAGNALPAPSGERLGAGAILVTAAAAGLLVAATGVLEPAYVFALGVGALGAIAVVLKPEVGLLAVAAFTVLRLPDVASDFHGAPSLFQPLVALIGVALALRWLTTGERPAGGGRAAAALIAFGLLAFGSLIMAEAAADGVGDLELFARDAIVAVLVGMLLRSTAMLNRVVWALVSGAALMGTLSVFQVLTGSFDTTFGGLAQSEVLNIVGRVDDVRISGPIGDPNFYAQWLVMLIPFALDRMWKAGSVGARVLAGYAAAVSGAAVVFTFSRGGAVALAVVVGAMLVRHPPRPRTVVGVLVAVALTVPLLPSEYVGRLTTLGQIGSVDSTTDVSIRSRTSQIGSGMAMFSDSPILGQGYGTYQERYPEYAREVGIDLASKPREAHNLYLEVAAETGIVGIIVFGSIIFFAFASITVGRRQLRRIGAFDGDNIGYAVAVAIVGYLITSAFLHMAFSRLPWLIVGIGFALPSIAATMRRAASPREPAWR